MRFVPFVIFVLFLGTPALAQSSGQIQGMVIDAASGTPLVGANIALVGADKGSSSDIEGMFILGGIAPGNYQLEASMIGYIGFHRHLEVSENDSLFLAIELSHSPIHLDETLVQADRSFSAASARSVRNFDLRLRPKGSAHQMLQVAPGLIIAQHAGGGKAEQIFLRNFDADHGTDVAISVDGMPVNMVSHGHGQGYADLHFLIPDVVERLEVFKGPYFAGLGNLATAGAVEFQTRDHIDRNMLRLGGGSFGSADLTGIYQLPLDSPRQSAYVAGSYTRSDGPVDKKQGLQRFNIFAKLHTHLGEHASLSTSFDAFSSAWDASGQIPQRAVRAGRIDRWGAIDPLEGGTTSRRNLNLVYEARDDEGRELIAQAYFTHYDFKLFSNFTFFRENPTAGDMIEQTDDRFLAGFNSRYAQSQALGPLPTRRTIGAGFRQDDIAVGLWHSPDRSRAAALVDAGILERNFYLWLQEDIGLGEDLRLVLGLRGDYFTFNVNDHLEGSPASLPHASGLTQQAILNPKASLVYSPTQTLDLFANFGTGFHSNDARNNVINRRVADLASAWRQDGLDDEAIDIDLAALNFDPGHRGVTTLPRAIGIEVGARTHLARRLNLGAALWLLDIEEEFVFVGDAGTTEASGRTRRAGLDLEGRLQVAAWLWADADLNLSRGRARDEPSGADKIALAPDLTSTGGLTARHPDGWEAALRYRHIGDRPANENGSVTAQGYTVTDLNAAYNWSSCRLELTVENLLDTQWNEAQFDTESRLDNETTSVSEIHFTPGNPLGARLMLSYFF
jgi:outer membrane receptor protein involved in Fe transport